LVHFPWEKLKSIREGIVVYYFWCPQLTYSQPFRVGGSKVSIILRVASLGVSVLPFNTSLSVLNRPTLSRRNAMLNERYRPQNSRHLWRGVCQEMLSKQTYHSFMRGGTQVLEFFRLFYEIPYLLHTLTPSFFTFSING